MQEQVTPPEDGHHNTGKSCFENCHNHGFTLAGTLYLNSTGNTAFSGATITITDDNNQTPRYRRELDGNFYSKRADRVSRARDRERVSVGGEDDARGRADGAAATAAATSAAAVSDALAVRLNVVERRFCSMRARHVDAWRVCAPTDPQVGARLIVSHGTSDAQEAERKGYSVMKVQFARSCLLSFFRRRRAVVMRDTDDASDLEWLTAVKSPRNPGRRRERRRRRRSRRSRRNTPRLSRWGASSSRKHLRRRDVVSRREQADRKKAEPQIELARNYISTNERGKSIAPRTRRSSSHRVEPGVEHEGPRRAHRAQLRQRDRSVLEGGRAQRGQRVRVEQPRLHRAPAEEYDDAAEHLPRRRRKRTRPATCSTTSAPRSSTSTARRRAHGVRGRWQARLEGSALDRKRLEGVDVDCDGDRRHRGCRP